jgi:hypothetical protein
LGLGVKPATKRKEAIMPLYFLPMIFSEMALASMVSIWQLPNNDKATVTAPLPE